MNLRLLKSYVKHAYLSRLNPQTLSTWYYNSILHSRKNPELNGAGPVYFEFGVGSGNSLVEYLRAVELYCYLHKDDVFQFRIVAFDSFQGLPKIESAADDFRDWGEGRLSFSLESVRARIQTFHFPEENIRFVQGFFSDSLTEALKAELRSRPPSIVMVDCDYYSSTKHVLDWLQDFVKSGTAFFFDDIWAFWGSPDHGQIKAIKEINAKGKILLTPFPRFGFPDHSYACLVPSRLRADA